MDVVAVASCSRRATRVGAELLCGGIELALQLVHLLLERFEAHFLLGERQLAEWLKASFWSTLVL